MRIIYITALLGALTACGPSLSNDPIYAALKANPPTTIPAQFLPKLRQGRFACEVFNEGKGNQYMTCWWPSGKPVRSATLSYYGPTPISPPTPSKISVPGGAPITGFLPLTKENK